MNDRIKFKRLTNFTGRNGYFKASGMDFLLIPDDDGDKLMIAPLTSKGGVGRCDITIPVEDIPKLINVLEKFKL